MAQAANEPLVAHFRIHNADRLSDLVEIVGVVKDSKYGWLREEIAPTAYLAWNQNTLLGPQANFELRASRGMSNLLTDAVRVAMRESSPDASLEFTSLASKVNDSLARERLLATLSGVFGALALLLAAIGLYGVMSYTIARRRNEIGIRMALGANPSDVLRMVLGEVALLISAGLMMGLPLVLATGQFVASFLYGLRPSDPLTLSLAMTILAIVAVAAGYFPAKRASSLEPVIALREE